MQSVSIAMALQVWRSGRHGARTVVRKAAEFEMPRLRRAIGRIRSASLGQTIIGIGKTVMSFFSLRRSHGKRVLIHEILSLQLIIIAIIGALSIAGLYWGGQWVLQDNYSRWALQWTEELNELGAPLFLPDDSEVMIRLESFIEKYPEIDRVTYYREDGTVLRSMHNGNPGGDQSDDLSRDMTDELIALVGSESPYRVERSFANVRAFEILAPVWTESLESDGLFDFDPTADDSRSSYRLIGFVGLNLDFMLFHDRLLTNIKIAITVLLLLLIVSGFLGRRSLQRALSAISDLQEPIAELAKGNLDVQFKPAAHREISEIVEALESTASALGERDARLLKLANHDVLTGLYNRRRLVDELKKEIDNVTQTDGCSSLLFIDLDQFKYVNDTCGHPAGDRLIRKVADQLKRSVDDDGIVARFGGDEFAVLAPGLNKRKSRKLGQTILEDMRRLAHIENNNVFHVHCSIGITMITSGRFDHNEIFAQADIACREAKVSGRNRLEFYSMSVREAERMVADVGWMSRLRESIDNDGLVLRYQPIVEISTGKISHHEVLLRMRGDDGKEVAPDAFLSAAVRFGLMAELDNWVVTHAIEALAEYRKKQPGLRFAINLSANAFETQNLADIVQIHLEKHGVPANAIVIEITESLAVRHLSYVEQQMAALRRLGCELALDDFGTGYSSFGYLQRLPMDYIKIDGCFIRDLVRSPVDQKMVRLIGEIGREAGMKTIAEYVKDGEALSLLGELGIDFAQGYFIGRPELIPVKKAMPIPLSAKKRKQPKQAGA
ncbi:MAG: EAL domain-containing protein [Woeseiaceae bacterium]|nr:EAL domain-containing protein [Woeseiaceae bacterium]